MASEITITAALSFFKPAVMGTADGDSISNGQFNMTGNVFSKGSIVVTTTATAIPLGQVMVPHWAFFRNKDATNYVTIRNGVNGADLLQLFPGEASPIPLFGSCVPYAVAGAASVLLQFLIVSQ